MRRLIFLLGVMLGGIVILPGASTLPMPVADRFETAQAVCSGRVRALVSFKEGGQWRTEAMVTVDTVFKGTFAAEVRLVHRGGEGADGGEVDSGTPRLRVGEERVFFLGREVSGAGECPQGDADAPQIMRNRDGRLMLSSRILFRQLEALSVADAAGADFTGEGRSRVKSTAGVGPRVVGGLLTTGGYPARFTTPDRGEVIPCWLDVQAMPAGMTSNQVFTALTNVFRAWSSASSVRFSFAGFTNFGMAAPSVAATDGAIRIQSHNLYNYITNAGTVGRGGRGFDTSIVGSGGRLGTQEFYGVTRGYMVLVHTNSYMTNLVNFTEVMAHEMGHVLGLDHSSQTVPEANGYLSNALMYIFSHGDGRGARLSQWDTNFVLQLNPTTNTPPYTFVRHLDVVTASSIPGGQGINQYEIRGFDLQSTNLTRSTNNITTFAGTWSFSSNRVTYLPSAAWGADSIPRTDLLNYIDGFDVRFSDGTNASPWTWVRVVSFSPDTKPSASSDGIPDAWMVTYFGNADPTAGAGRGATNDFDGDGFSNRDEYRLGTSPVKFNSRHRITGVTRTNLTFPSVAYDLYEVQTSTNLTSWQRSGMAVYPSSTNATATLRLTNAPRMFYRVERVP